MLAALWFPPGTTRAAIFRLFFCLGTGRLVSFRRCKTRPLEPTKVTSFKLLTTYERHALKVVPPFLVDLHRLPLVSFSVGSEPGTVGMLNHVTNIVGVHRVEDGEEVGSVREPVLRVLVLQILHHLAIAKELWEHVLDTELVIMGNSDELAIAHLEQLLFPLKYLAQEVTVYGRCRGDV